MRRYIILVLALLVIVALMQIAPELPEAAADSSDDYGWMKVETVQCETTTAGGLGAATGTCDTAAVVHGHLYGVYFDWAPVGSLPAATDMVMSVVSPSLTILTLTNVMTDSWYYPVITQTSTTGSATTSMDRTPINGQVHFALAQTYPITGQKTLTVTLLWGQ